MRKLILSLILGILLVSCAMAQVYKGSASTSFRTEPNTGSGSPMQVSSADVASNLGFNLIWIAIGIIALVVIIYFLFKKKKKVSTNKKKKAVRKKKL